jgi:HAE1 family hydrophobic/amphiphilic exporter-1
VAGGASGVGSEEVSVSSGFIKRPIGTTLLMAAILLVGIAPIRCCRSRRCRRSISRPSRSPPAARRQPRDHGLLVAQPLERSSRRSPASAQMTSTSVLGSTQITLQFDLNRNIDAAAKDVQAAINAASGQLPKNLPSPPTYRKVNPADSPDPALAVQSDTLPLTRSTTTPTTSWRSRSAQISGVGQVTIGGQQKPPIRVQVDPAKLAKWA